MLMLENSSKDIWVGTSRLLAKVFDQGYPMCYFLPCLHHIEWGEGVFFTP